MIDQKMIERCIAPITVEQPVGADLRTNTALHARYYQMKDCRNAARDLERRQAQGESIDERADWKGLAKLCVETLSTTTKDLEVASWLVEALLRLQGLAGMGAGFTILSAMIKNYWETIYPLPDEDGLITRLAPLISLNGDEYEGTLIRPIYHVLLTQGQTTGPFALWQYQQALDNTKLTDTIIIERRKAQGSVFMSSIQTAVNESTAEFYQKLQQDHRTVQQVFAEYNVLLTKYCAEQAPPQTRILSVLDEFGDYLRFIIKDSTHQDILHSVVPVTVNSAIEDVLTLSSTSLALESDEKGGTMLSGELNNREQALQLLGNIAAYFRKTEPQSPLPYVLERAQQLGRLSFPELLRELVNDEAARSAAYKLMGLQSDQQG